MAMTHQVLKDAFIILALVWFVVRALRDPGDRALRLVVAALTAQLVGEYPVINVLRAWTGLSAPAGKVVQNAALCCMYFCLLLFFWMSAAGVRRRGTAGSLTGIQRRVWLEFGILLGVVVVFATTVSLTPPEIRASAYPADGSLQHAALNRPEVVTFYVAGMSYFGYTALQSFWWALVYASEASRRAKIGLRVAAFGMATFGLSALGRASFAIATGFGVPVPESFAIVANALVDVGVYAYVGGALGVGAAARWAAFRVWLRHRRVHDELRPLWTSLHELFPDDELDRGGRGLWHDRLSPWQGHRRYWRRAVEIRDGLVRLSPHLADAGWDDTRPPSEQAQVVSTAMQRFRSGDTPQSPAAVPILVSPSDGTLDDDVHSLIELSRAFARTHV